MFLCNDIKEELKFLKKYYPEKYRLIKQKSIKTAFSNALIAVIFSISLPFVVIPFFNADKIIGIIIAVMAVILILVTMFSIFILIREKLLEHIRPFNLGFNLKEDMILKNNIEKIKKEEDEMNKILLINNIQNKVVSRKRI